ncbi:hypothetical protein B0H17DRAFT_1125051 [Mycena rosella]|uniref:Uncharacterized protein n=1 Tax=Mycena rosella TaxID=1033263 RepID=A0AAD7GZ22_MYCRO|nr:hypothetical protein B0H17DRAFT_1125051 [Mycena rosella]
MGGVEDLQGQRGVGQGFEGSENYKLTSEIDRAELRATWCKVTVKLHTTRRHGPGPGVGITCFVWKDRGKGVLRRAGKKLFNPISVFRIPIPSCATPIILSCTNASLEIRESKKSRGLYVLPAVSERRMSQKRPLSHAWEFILAIYVSSQAAQLLEPEWTVLGHQSFSSRKPSGACRLPAFDWLCCGFRGPFHLAPMATSIYILQYFGMPKLQESGWDFLEPLIPPPHLRRFDWTLASTPMLLIWINICYETQCIGEIFIVRDHRNCPREAKHWMLGKLGIQAPPGRAITSEYYAWTLILGAATGGSSFSRYLT